MFPEQRGGFVGETKGGGVGDFPELAADGGVDFRMLVAVKICPDRRVAVEVFAAVDVAKDGAASRGDDDGLAFEPVAHLGERVPEVLMIELGELMHRGGD